MSNIFGAPRAGAPNGQDEARSVPKGDTVGSYNSYLDAQKAVDYLADQQFPVQMVSIVGNDLKMVERVTGRLTYPRVALSGCAERHVVRPVRRHHARPSSPPRRGISPS